MKRSRSIAFSESPPTTRARPHLCSSSEICAKIERQNTTEIGRKFSALQKRRELQSKRDLKSALVRAPLRLERETFFALISVPAWAQITCEGSR